MPAAPQFDPYASIAVPLPSQSDPYAAIAKPIAQPDTRSLFQKAKDNFNANTQGAKHVARESNADRFKADVENVGAGGGDVIRSIGHAVLHPYDTAVSAVEAQRAENDKPISEQLKDLVTSGKVLGPGGEQIVGTVKGLIHDPARTVGQIGTGAIVGEAAAPVVSAAASGIDNIATLPKKLYPTSQSIVPSVSAARNLSKALVVDPAGVKNFVNAATDEAGTIVGYAKDNDLPINSKLDFANAAKQTADAVQTHLDEKFVDPNRGKVVAVPSGFQGRTVGEGNNATLGEVSDRINAISSELKSNFRKPLSAQTSAANTSDADLISEKNALTDILHKHVAQATGVEPEVIANLRQQAGKLRTIADESMASANRDLTAAGKQAMGTTTSAVGTKAGLIDRGLQMVQGGPEVIGNRQINSALRKVQPTPLNLPQPIAVEVVPPAPRGATGGPPTVIPSTDYTPDPNAANILRDRIAARQPAPIEPAPRPVKQMQKWADAGAAKMSSQGMAAADVDKLSALPAGRQLLIKASGMSSDSMMLKNLILQAKQLLATGTADYR